MTQTKTVSENQLAANIPPITDLLKFLRGMINMMIDCGTWDAGTMARVDDVIGRTVDEYLAALASRHQEPIEPADTNGFGWVFWNPDSGEEYSLNHPIESGECPDAERIRSSTSQEDVLYEAMQGHFQALHAASIPKPGASGAAMIEQMSDEEFNRDRSNENPNVGKIEPGVKVKPLEWRVPTDHPKDPDIEDNVLCADGIGGVYAISKKQKVGPERLLWMADDPFDWKGYGSILEAKAAAQADYEQRIRSALEPSTSEDHIPDAGKMVGAQASASEGEPAYWEYELATQHFSSGYDNWEPRLTKHHPHSPEAAVRNLRPLFYAAPQPTPVSPLPVGVRPTHRHKKRGTEYVLIGIGKMQAEEWLSRVQPVDGTGFGFSGNALMPVDMREVAIYRSATDPTEIWVRPREEFEDGRFEAITDALSPKPGEQG
jgi:hypothetical protein